MTKNLILLLLLGFLLFQQPGLSQAQDLFDEPQHTEVNWQELKTEYFVIVYATSIDNPDQSECPFCGVEEAEKYAQFVDNLYLDLVDVFGTELTTPIRLHLFPTEQSYFEINPIAEYLTGVIAHAANNRAEIAVAVPRTQDLAEEQLLNNMRHEFTHLFASKLSDGHLSAGFQEGISQYLEKPTNESAKAPALLQLASEQNRLLSWDELDKSQQIYSDPQVAYPQTLAVVSFLIDRYGFPKFLEFLQATATEPGYRATLNTTYDKSAEMLETEWLEYLPAYIDNRWKINAIYSYDLGRVTDLVNRGAYSDAKIELAEIIELLETTNQQERLAQANALLEKATQGQAANMLADEARMALVADDYALTIEKAQTAQEAYDALGFRDRVPEVQTYIYRAEIGQEAIQQLEQGENMLNSLRFLEAERHIYEATIRLQALNNQTATEAGVALLQESARRQSLIAYILLVTSGLLVVANLVHRFMNRWIASPLEIEF